MKPYQKKVASHRHHTLQLAMRLEVKSLDESGVFAGYGSVFNMVDSQRDVVLPGAFTETLARRGSDVKLLWQHDVREPIGRIEALREDGQGLYLRGRLLLEVARAREAYALMKAGVLSGLSIGYSPVRYRTDPDTGVRMLSQLDLWEVSLVTFPANEAARVTVVKQEPVSPAALARMHRALLHALQALRQMTP
jgi:HK97 family phage prohead protease